MRSEWHATDADPETAARIKDEWSRILTALGDAAPEPDAERGVAITADNEIHFTTATAMFALAPSGVAVCYRPLPNGAEDVSYWQHGQKIRHRFNPPQNESN